MQKPKIHLRLVYTKRGIVLGLECCIQPSQDFLLRGVAAVIKRTQSYLIHKSVAPYYKRCAAA